MGMRQMWKNGRAKRMKRSLEAPVWRIHTVISNNRTRYRIGSSSAFVGWSHPLYCVMPLLAESDVRKKRVHPDVNEALSHVDTINSLLYEKYGNEPHCAGVYLISLKDQNGQEHAMYVGQSRNLGTRMKQHEDNLHKALLMFDKTKPLDDLKRKLAHLGIAGMYAELAEAISFGDHMITHQWCLPHGFVQYTYRCRSAAKSRMADPHAVLNESLCVYEQHLMDCFNPRLNVISARMPSKP